jgi:hypothetical protein
MTNHSKPTPGVAGYQPPRVERVLTPAELEQEIVYAGQDNSQPA